MRLFRVFIAFILAVLAVIFLTKPAWAFCGFYVAKADANLYNEASQVAIARDGSAFGAAHAGRTVLTMANEAMFKTTYERENRKVAFLEYAGDMGSCDPCSAQPLTPDELRQAGVFWLTPNAPTNAFISRLHPRYTRDKFPEDLQFQETSNRQLFQGRYIIRHPFKGEIDCQAAQDYQGSVRERQEKEAQTLARLTGWNLNEIRRKINFLEVKPIPWWRNIWR